MTQRGSSWTTSRRAGHRAPGAVAPPPQLAVGCLRHHIEQLEYLRRNVILPAEFDGVIAKYKRLLDESIVAMSEQRVALTPALDALIGATYARIINLRCTRALAPAALSADWSRHDAQTEYFNHPFGLVVIDNFLTEAALARSPSVLPGIDGVVRQSLRSRSAWSIFSAWIQLSPVNSDCCRIECVFA